MTTQTPKPYFLSIDSQNVQNIFFKMKRSFLDQRNETLFSDLIEEKELSFDGKKSLKKFIEEDGDP